MPAFRRFRRTTKIVRRRRIPKRGVASKSKSSIKRVVKQVLSRNIETKLVEFLGENGIKPYSATTGYTDTIKPISPYSGYMEISQGAGQSQRIGNTIKTKSLIMEGFIRAQRYHATQNPDPRPVYVKLLFCTSKSNKTVLDIQLQDLFQNNGSSRTPSGGLTDIYALLNKDDWMIHKVLTFKLGFAYDAGTSSDQDAQFYANNDFKLQQYFRVNLTKFMPKVVKYSDNITTPQTNMIQMIPLLAAYDNSAYGTAEIPAVMNYHTYYTYTDA